MGIADPESDIGVPAWFWATVSDILTDTQRRSELENLLTTLVADLSDRLEDLQQVVYSRARAHVTH